MAIRATSNPLDCVAEQLGMRDEAAASLATAPGEDLRGDADLLLTRFANAALPHSLSQIAMDGSQKIGPRWLEPIAANRAAGRASPATLTALAAWLRFVGGQGWDVVDPNANRLRDMWAVAGRDGVADAVFGDGGMFGQIESLTTDERAYVREAIRRCSNAVLVLLDTVRQTRSSISAIPWPTPTHMKASA